MLVAWDQDVDFDDLLGQTLNRHAVQSLGMLRGSCCFGKVSMHFLLLSLSRAGVEAGCMHVVFFLNLSGSLGFCAIAGVISRDVEVPELRSTTLKQQW